LKDKGLPVSTLFLVATPIGNLDDISARALRVLREVRQVLAEDTRHTTRLLHHYGIHTPLLSYHEHNKAQRQERVLAALAEGDVALVSDAGTPALNDPGYELVRAALQAGYTVTPIPGPCAPIAALVASGLPTDAFLYLGYLPRKSTQRRRLLADISSQPYTLVFLEAPHRLMSALEDIRATLGDRRVSVARELTKLHEEIFRGTLGQALERFTDRPPKGEITLVIAGSPTQRIRWSESALKDALQASSATGQPAAQIARQLAGFVGQKVRSIPSAGDESMNSMITLL
jgi:16S rRNA (cytidine1402-2'-O)-methyltransferase